MRAFSRKPATYEDLKALPEDVVGELIDGELYVSHDLQSDTAWPRACWAVT